MMTGDELYKSMISTEFGNVTPTETELVAALQNWITWANQYSSLIDISPQFVDACNATVELLSRYELSA